MQVFKYIRILLGLLAMLAVGLLFDFLPSIPTPHYRIFDFFWVFPGLESAVLVFVAAAAGAFVARVRFVVPAIAFTALSWALGVYILNQIGAPMGQDNILELAGSNILGLLFGIIGAGLGARIGEKISRPIGARE